jgi:two-component system sensor kinase FixL
MLAPGGFDRRNREGEPGGFYQPANSSGERSKMSSSGGKPSADSSAEDRIAQQTAALKEREYRFQAVVNTAVDAILTIDTDGIIESFNPAAEKMFGYRASEAIGQSVNLLMPSPHREHHDEYIRRYRETNVPHVIGTTRELQAVRKDGSLFPIRLSVAEIDRMGLYTGIVRDITEERRLQEEVVRIATLEQRRIGQELHDHLQQELTGLGLLAQSLAEELVSGEHPAAGAAARLAQGISDAHAHVRALAQGLVPADIDADGLVEALRRLASGMEETDAVHCRFEQHGSIESLDDAAATQLYRIAQEAANNAVKHASANAVTIRLGGDDQGVALEVRDDGIGMPRHPPTEGVGLRIMEHRCSLLGARLLVGACEGGGTLVRCFVPLPAGD